MYWSSSNGNRSRRSTHASQREEGVVVRGTLSAGLILHLTKPLLCRGYSGPDGGPCTACPVGKFKAVTGSSLCINCAPGHYQDNTARTTCVNCWLGSFQAQEQKTTCETCPSGKAGTVTSGPNETVGCNVHCSPGYYSAAPYKTACSQCGANMYSDAWLTGWTFPCHADAGLGGK